MAKPEDSSALSEKQALYEKLIATNPKIERKGDAVPYTSINGHMFSYLSKEGKLALRLPSAEREVFLKRHQAKLCDAYGRVFSWSTLRCRTRCCRLHGNSRSFSPSATNTQRR